MTRAEFLREADAWLLSDALKRHNGSVTAAALDLGGNRANFYKVASRAGVDVEAFRDKLRGPPTRPLSEEFKRFLGARPSTPST
jgi:hypothetical protein